MDIDRRELLLRDTKSRRDRRGILPERLVEPVRLQLADARRVHTADLAAGAGRVVLPTALHRKYPDRGREWPWQWVFPATRLYWDAAIGERRRHHFHQTAVQRAFRLALRSAGIPKAASCHTLRNAST